MAADMKAAVADVLSRYDPQAPQPTADALRDLWLRFDPNRTANAFSAEAREQQVVVGIPISDLRSIAKEVAKPAPKRVADYVPLMQLLWDAYGREGRVVALIPLGKMELAAPETVLPLLLRLCRTCVTWEDADRMAMNALEPIVRKDPVRWLPAIEPWLFDENKWVRRAGVTVVGRLPMKHPDTTERCLSLMEGLLLDEDVDVKKAVSFAVRLAARGDAIAVRDFLMRHVPPADPAATWVLCDAIRSMGKSLLPDFGPLSAGYEAWLADPKLSARDRRSVESALRCLADIKRPN